MNIIVLVKQVPESEELRYDQATRTLVREGVTNNINTFDKRALTEAVRLRGLHGGYITAVTMGPAQARSALIECLGRGVDRCIHISDRLFAASDTLATARTLAVALRRLSFDLLLLGKWSTDSETGQVGPELAELLGLPQVTGATSIEYGQDGLLRVSRETDVGFERLKLHTPAVLTAAERLIKPTKTTPEVQAAGQRLVELNPGLIKIWSAYDLGIKPEDAGLAGSPTWVAELRSVEVDRTRTVLSGDIDSLAKNFLAEVKARWTQNAALSDARNPLLPDAVTSPDSTYAVWAVAEWLPGSDTVGAHGPHLRAVSLELIGAAAGLAAQLGGEAVGVLLGSGVGGLAGELVANGAGTVLVADSPTLALYTVEVYAHVISEAIRQYEPWTVLLPATSFGRDLAPRVAARLGLGLVGDCVGLVLDSEDRLQMLKPAFGGVVVAPILSRTMPQMATVRPGMLPHYAPMEGRQGRIVPLDIANLPESRVRVVEVTQEGQAGLALDNAQIVVCVGNGVGGPEAIPEVERFAQTLGRWLGLAPAEVAIGGTRKVVDAGWLPRHQQIGITGRSLSTPLYVGLGVQGNYNHTAALTRVGTVASVNLDPHAPIFQSSDIGIVAPWREFVEAVMEVLRSPD